jgi:hypothetical protein
MCYSHDNTDNGFDGSHGMMVMLGTVVDSNGDRGVHINGVERGSFFNNVFYNNTNEGVEITETKAEEVYFPVFNNIFKDNGSYAYELQGEASVTAPVWDYNCYHGNNAGGTQLLGISPGANDTTSDPDFVNAPGGDFTLNSGSPCLDAGLGVDTFTAITGDYKWNIGSDQDDVAAGGTTTYTHGSISAHTNM